MEFSLSRFRSCRRPDRAASRSVAGQKLPRKPRKKKANSTSRDDRSRRSASASFRCTRKFAERISGLSEAQKEPSSAAMRGGAAVRSTHQFDGIAALEQIEKPLQQRSRSVVEHR